MRNFSIGHHQMSFFIPRGHDAEQPIHEVNQLKTPQNFLSLFDIGSKKMYKCLTVKRYLFNNILFSWLLLLRVITCYMNTRVT